MNSGLQKRRFFMMLPLITQKDWLKYLKKHGKKNMAQVLLLLIKALQQKTRIFLLS